MVERNGMSTEEAGRKGGETTSRNHGHDFYSRIGQKGGKSTSMRHGREFYEEIGRKGGSKSRRN